MVASYASVVTRTRRSGRAVSVESSSVSPTSGTCRPRHGTKHSRPPKISSSAPWHRRVKRPRPAGARAWRALASTPLRAASHGLAKDEAGSRSEPCHARQEVGGGPVLNTGLATGASILTGYEQTE